MKIGLLTCVGSITSQTNIRCLRAAVDMVVGTDLLNDAVGRNFVDEFIPSCTGEMISDEYLPSVPADSECYVFVCSDEEAMHLSKYKDAFKNVRIMLSDHDCLMKAFNKNTFYSTLEENALNHPKFIPVLTTGDLEKACRELGYPERKIVVKPSLGRGGRGVYVLDQDARFSFSEKPVFHLPLDQFCQLIEKNESSGKPDFLANGDNPVLACEYLEGQPWSVDLVSYKGKLICAVPKMKLKGDNFTTTQALIVENKELIETVKKIVEIYDYSFIGNIEFKERRSGDVVPFDFNARVASSSGSAASVGVNFFKTVIELEDTGSTSVKQDSVEYGASVYKYLTEIRA